MRYIWRQLHRKIKKTYHGLVKDSIFTLFILLKVRTVTNQVPVNRKAEEQSTSEDEPTSKPINERLASWKKTVDTPSKATTVSDPTELPLSERFAGKTE